jgi:hypothetical protein
MAVQGLRITVGTTATVLSSLTPPSPIDYNQRGFSTLIQNPTGGVTVYLGGPDVTTTTYGYSLAAGSSMSVDLFPGDLLYGVVATGTQALGILRTGV